MVHVEYFPRSYTQSTQHGPVLNHNVQVSTSTLTHVWFHIATYFPKSDMTEK